MRCAAPPANGIAMIAGRLVSGPLGTSAVTHRRPGETDWNSPTGNPVKVTARDGVLAVRVWKQAPHFDPVEIGGLDATPLIGSPEARREALQQQRRRTRVRPHRYSPK